MIKSLTLSIGLALTLATPAFGTIEWGFDANANPAIAADGPGSAAITVGQFGDGWLNGGAIPSTLGNAQGDWDLGKRITAPTGGAIIDRMVLTLVPQPAAVIAGALLLVPFALSTIRVLRRDRAPDRWVMAHSDPGSAIA